MIEVWNQNEGVWTYLFNIDDIGFHIVNSDKSHYFLINEKIKKYIFKGITWRINDFDNMLIEKPTGIKTRVVCPVCKKGLMILVKKKLKRSCEIFYFLLETTYIFRCERYDKCITFFTI